MTFFKEKELFQREFSEVYKETVENLRSSPKGATTFEHFKINETCEETLSFIFKEMEKGLFPYKRKERHYFFDNFALLMIVEKFIRQYGYRLQYAFRADDYGVFLQIERI